VVLTVFFVRGQILRLTCSKFYFGWGSAPESTLGTYSAPSARSWILGDLPQRKRRVGKGGEGKEGNGREGVKGKGKGGNVKFLHLLLSNLITAMG